MVEITSADHGVIGSRMTGASFGGCTVHLVYQDAVDALADRIQTKYPPRTDIEPEIYVCTASNGVYTEPANKRTSRLNIMCEVLEK